MFIVVSCLLSYHVYCCIIFIVISLLLLYHNYCFIIIIVVSIVMTMIPTVLNPNLTVTEKDMTYSENRQREKVAECCVSSQRYKNENKWTHWHWWYILWIVIIESTGMNCCRSAHVVQRLHILVEYVVSMNGSPLASPLESTLRLNNIFTVYRYRRVQR